MTHNTLKPRGATHALAISCLAAAFLVSASVPARAEPDASSERGLVGTWTIQVTLRNCTTGAPLGPAFNSLVTFHGDGTLSETAASLAFAPGQRSPGQGAWSRRRGHSYRQEMIALLLFDTEPNVPGTPTFDPAKPVSPGFFAGWVTVNHAVRLTATGQLESTGTNGFYKTNGELYRSGCSTATGQRF
jgi:hypothetical protein